MSNSFFYQGDDDSDEIDPHFYKNWTSDAVPMPEVGESEKSSFPIGAQLPARVLRSPI